jgi:hypothetical protein
MFVNQRGALLASKYPALGTLTINCSPSSSGSMLFMISERNLPSRFVTKLPLIGNVYLIFANFARWQCEDRLNGQIKIAYQKIKLF